MGESTIGIPASDEPRRGGLRELGRKLGQIDEIGVIGALVVLIVLLAALIQNGLALLAVPPAWSVAVTGIVIIVAVTLDYLIKRRQ